MDMERFNLKKLNEEKLKKGIRLQSKTSLWFWKKTQLQESVLVKPALMPHLIISLLIS
jgi:hypothetical protein